MAYFGDGGYTEIATRVPFYYGPSPVLTTSAPNYNVGQVVPIQYSNCPAKPNDWIGVYKIGMTPGGPASVKWTYISATNGTYNVSGLQKGYYFATYLLKDQYFEAGPRVFFSVGDTITTLTTNQSNYNLGEYISATWVDGPGNPKDWLGIYADTASYDNFVSYTYIDGQPNGGRNIPDSAMPHTPGNYFIVLFTNDSYDEVSNRVYFQMIDNPLPLHLLDFSGKTEGMGHLLSWKVTGEEPGERYILQHGTDGKSFKDIFETGVLHQLRGNYEYLNENAAPGDNFYRLRMLNADNKETLSQIVQMHLNDKGENTVTVYPNPTRTGNRSIIESPYPIDQIDIVDISGQLIYQTKNINGNKFSLLHQELPAGTYILRIHSRKLYTAKLVITN